VITQLQLIIIIIIFATVVFRFCFGSQHGTCWLPNQKLDMLLISTIVKIHKTKISTCYGPVTHYYRGVDKSLARPTSRFIMFDGENISFDASLVIYVYINSTNIPPIMIINRIYETQILLSLQLISFLVRLRNYQHPCTNKFYNIC
jgi:hypothetical protein